MMIKRLSLLFLAILLFFVMTWRSATAESLGPISEETPPATCNPGSFISGIRCTGSYCDNIKISCAVFRGAALGRASWMPWVSEEQGLKGMPAEPSHCRAGVPGQLLRQRLALLRRSNKHAGGEL